MDEEDSGPARTRGGVVEPINRATFAKERFQTPGWEGGWYEHYDPFAEVTYRAKTFDEMVAKADRLGTSRFYAVSGDGKRSPVQKVNGVWRRKDLTADRALLPASVSKALVADVAPNISAANPGEADIAKIDAEAERVARAERLQAALAERYIIKRTAKVGDLTLGRTEYRYRGDTLHVAFTETSFRLATDTNSPSVARSMVDVAEARNWQGLRISGHYDFKRLVWLEASVRGVKALGYEPQQADIELVRREREARQVNRIEPTQNGADSPTAGESKQSARGNGGRKAVLAALEAVLIAKHVPPRQREAVMAAAAENLARRIAAGEVHKVKVYDRAAEPQRTIVRPTPEQQRTRERIEPVR
jgi:hypothetical protein